MVSLTPTRLHWIRDDGLDDPNDLCAHSPIHFEIDGAIIVAPGDGDFTVSASALYLLRTLDRDHTKQEPVGEHLFPCCGHVMYDTGDPDVLIFGCPNGFDFEVIHNREEVFIGLPDSRSLSVELATWRNAVVGFSSVVRDFYSASQPKVAATSEETAGYKKMLSEWDRRLQ